MSRLIVKWPNRLIMGVAPLYGFLGSWWYDNYGIRFDKEVYHDINKRIEVWRKMCRVFSQRFGDLCWNGTNCEDWDSNPVVVGFDSCTLPALLGCKVEFRENDYPWAIPRNLSGEEVEKLKVPDITSTYPMSLLLNQLDEVKRHYGRGFLDIDFQGVQNIATLVRGDHLYADYYQKPDIAHRVLEVVTRTIIALYRFLEKELGQEKPVRYSTAECTVSFVSNQIYEDFLLKYDNMLSENLCDESHPFWVHYCGDDFEKKIPGFLKIKNLCGMEIGPKNDVKVVREAFPDVEIRVIFDPVMLGKATKEEIEVIVRNKLTNGASFISCCGGIDSNVPDENIRWLIQAVAEFEGLSI